MIVINAVEFLKTIYLGDRYCTKMIFDGINNVVEVHINCISRVRDVSGYWNYYNDENIENGVIVISGIQKIVYDKNGLIPNDEISIQAQPTNNGNYEFLLEACYVDKEAQSHDVTISVFAEDVYLIDPTNPVEKITK